MPLAIIADADLKERMRCVRVIAEQTTVSAVGEDAFARLVRPEMRARVSPAPGAPKDRTLFREVSELLIDSLRRNKLVAEIEERVGTKEGETDDGPIRLVD